MGNDLVSDCVLYVNDRDEHIFENGDILLIDMKPSKIKKGEYIYTSDGMIKQYQDKDKMIGRIVGYSRRGKIFCA